MVFDFKNLEKSKHFRNTLVSELFAAPSLQINDEARNLLAKNIKQEAVVFELRIPAQTVDSGPWEPLASKPTRVGGLVVRPARALAVEPRCLVLDANRVHVSEARIAVFDA